MKKRHAPSSVAASRYFGAVAKNPADERTVIGFFPAVREGPPRAAFVGYAFSCDGRRFSSLRRLLNSTAASFGRGSDHPVDGIAVSKNRVYVYVHRDVPGVFAGFASRGNRRVGSEKSPKCRFSGNGDVTFGFRVGAAPPDLGGSRLVRLSGSLDDLAAATASAKRELGAACQPGNVPKAAGFDACWVRCLGAARSRGDTRRGGFLDRCLEPCYSRRAKR